VVLLVVVGALVAGACGKKGPPLPPLVKLPAAPDDFSAERRGADVKVQFTVPPANTDGTKPANLERIDVYRFTGPATVSDDQLLKFGTRIAQMPVKAPRNPDITTEPDEPAEEAELEDEGLDQGAVAQLEDELGANAFERVVLAAASSRGGGAVPAAAIEPAAPLPSTIYVAVGFNKRGRRGPLSKRILVPLLPTPTPPSSPAIDYDESTVRVTWTGSASLVPIQVPATGGELPGRFIGLPLPELSYHVYDVSPSAAATTDTAAPPVAGPLRLTEKPVAALRFDDARITWGATRCYAVRTVETIESLALESDATPPVCTTLVDTFPPAAPKDLKAVGTVGAINLIWEPNSESDIGGYIVLRGAWPSETLEPITPQPITDTTFSDATPADVHYVYAVQAVDKAGNVGPASNRADDTGR
jgi:hypothetical protein